jgi:YVTN family beta-propeller protein
VQPRPLGLSRRVRLRRTVAVASIAVTAGVAIVVTRSSPRATRVTATTVTTRATNLFVPPTTPPPPPHYREVVLLTLGHAVADPAAGAIGAQVLFAAGLDASSTSTARIGSILGRTVRTLPSLPAAFHDSAGAVIGNALYLFGGGDSVGQLDAIWRVDSNGTTTTAGTLPAPSSDSIAATIDGTAYVVGGYTGTRWLDTIVAYSPTRGARTVAHLPVGVRYAAVGAARGHLIIAGGTTPTAHASRAIYSFDPVTATVTKVGDLTQPITHASAVGTGDEVIVAGGQNEASEPQAAIVAINAATDHVRDAGTLLTARSDAAFVDTNGRLLLIGGKAASTTLNIVSELEAVTTVRHTNVYAHDGANALSPEAAAAKPLVYVPNSMSDTVSVIDPATYKVIDTFNVGAVPQHVTPSWDFKTLYVDNDHGNSLTPIDPRTGKRRGPDIPVTDPYNLYFTTDGRYAIVVAEARQRLDFRDAHTMRLVKSVPVPCHGIDHMDYTADGTVALASCEFSAQLVVIDVNHQTVHETIDLPNCGPSPKPQDVKLSPDGTLFYVADMNCNGVWEVNAQTFAIEGFLPTGAGAHGLYPSRDFRYLYVTNRGAGTVSVVDFSTRKIVQTWTIPGGSPDMGGFPPTAKCCGSPDVTPRRSTPSRQRTVTSSRPCRSAPDPTDSACGPNPAAIRSDTPASPDNPSGSQDAQRTASRRCHACRRHRRLRVSRVACQSCSAVDEHESIAADRFRRSPQPANGFLCGRAGATVRNGRT